MDLQINVIPDLVNLSQQLVATLILFLILRHFLFKPVTDLLQKRKAYIEEGVEFRQQADQELKQIQSQYEIKMLEAKHESSEIISSARKYSEDMKTKAVDESKMLAQEEYNKGILQLENERQKAMKSMNDEIVEIALSAAEKVLRKKADSDTDKQMVRSLIQDLEKTHEWESS